MTHFRLLMLVGALMAAFGAQSLVGRSGQAGQTPASAPRTGDGPFDALHFRPIGPAVDVRPHRRPRRL